MKLPIALHVFLWLANVLLLMSAAYLGSMLFLGGAMMGLF